MTILPNVNNCLPIYRLATNGMKTMPFSSALAWTRSLKLVGTDVGTAAVPGGRVIEFSKSRRSGWGSHWKSFLLSVWIRYAMFSLAPGCIYPPAKDRIRDLYKSINTFSGLRMLFIFLATDLVQRQQPDSWCQGPRSVFLWPVGDWAGSLRTSFSSLDTTWWSPHS